MELYELSLPFAAGLIVSGWPALLPGHVHWSLGLAAATLGQYELADDQYDPALEVDARIGFERPTWGIIRRMAARSSVPSRLSSFVGRKKELAELRRLLHHTRLLTLLGPGGCGKTRLATEFARHQESRFEDGSVFVGLGAVREESLVVDALARAAGVNLETGDQLAALSRYMRDRRLLVVADNCEHLVGAVGEVLVRLLTDCPHLTVVSTSRERLNVEGETVWRVPPMSMPPEGADAADLDNADAIRLFVDRARTVQPGFSLAPSNASAVLTICRRLDGIPLAIELAAARMTTLSPADIVPRLEDRLRLLTGGSRNLVPRQQTLRATIDWSYRLLNPSEQTLLQRMSVFAGSADADAVQEVCASPPLDRGAVLDALIRLVEKSMVQVDAGGGAMRYRLLETIREYAAEKLLGEEHAAAARDRHLARYCRLATEAFEVQKRRGAMAEHRRLWQEIDDVRAALEWSRGDTEVELDLLGSLLLLWMTHAPAEGFERLTVALRRVPPTTTPGRMRAAWAGAALGSTMQWEGDWVVSGDELESMIRELGDEYMAAQMQLGLGYLAERQFGDLERARRFLRSAVDLFEGCGAGPSQAMAMGSLGSVEMQLGRPDEARTWIERAVKLTLAVDDPYGAIGAYFHLARLELDHGSRAKALESFFVGLELVDSGDALSIAYQVEGIGCALAKDDPTYALRLFAAASRLRSVVAIPLHVPWGPRVEDSTRQARDALPSEEANAAWAAGEALSAEAVTAELRLRLRPGNSARPGPPGGLSLRELEIAELVASGMTSRAIAEKLFLAERTVESHLNHIMNKLGFNSRAQVAAWIAERRPRPGA